MPKATKTQLRLLVGDQTILLPRRHRATETRMSSRKYQEARLHLTGVSSSCSMTVPKINQEILPNFEGDYKTWSERGAWPRLTR